MSFQNILGMVSIGISLVFIIGGVWGIVNAPEGEGHFEIVTNIIRDSGTCCLILGLIGMVVGIGLIVVEDKKQIVVKYRR